jgi:(p)ppGpp synthase/HD superfamily hydrolase
MAEKLAVYAQRAGVTDIGLVLQAYQLAMQPRLEHLADVFHHDMLHPARTALILLENVGITAARVLAAAQVIETCVPRLRVVPEEIAAALGADVAALAAAVPDPVADRETLVEQLVTADDNVALIALAERLDHARHLHMRAPREWRDYFEQTVTVYLPLAQRLHPELQRRFERWAGAFEQRLR